MNEQIPDEIEIIDLDDPALEYPEENIELTGDEEEYPVEQPLLDDFINMIEREDPLKRQFIINLQKTVRSVIVRSMVDFNKRCTLWDINSWGLPVRNEHRCISRRITKYDLD